MEIFCVTYNVLAQRFADVNYPEIDSLVLAQPDRNEKIKKKILSCDPDIICLQEVELVSSPDDFTNEFSSRGYSNFSHVISKKRSNPIGNLIFWKKDKFRCQETTENSTTIFVKLCFSDTELETRKFQSPSAQKKFHENNSCNLGNDEISEAIDVKVLKVDWKPSKNGVLVPIVHFEKVMLLNANIEYVTGYNAKFIVDNIIGPGAEIRIARCSDIIPHIVNVIKPAEEASLPDDLEYKWNDDKINIIPKTNKYFWICNTHLKAGLRSCGQVRLSQLESTIKICNKHTDPIIICGDFNDDLKPDGLLMDILLKNKFTVKPFDNSCCVYNKETKSHTFYPFDVVTTRDCDCEILDKHSQMVIPSKDEPSDHYMCRFVIKL